MATRPPKSFGLTAHISAKNVAPLYAPAGQRQTMQTNLSKNQHDWSEELDDEDAMVPQSAI